VYSMRPFLVTLALGSALTLGLSPTFGQNSNSDQQSSVAHSALLLRRIVLKHPGCITCNDALMNQEEEYVEQHVKERPRVESLYQQKVVDDMKQALENFWRERGVEVKVTTTLTQVPSAARYAVLEFQVCKTY
jgi:hypothetical protein